ncbi:MAG TPA: hypothetical protein VNF47_13035 [Streptosporangiaceae bacterium]|nr:hypothetical protein [Streptosporangiaceae bacterium]
MSCEHLICAQCAGPVAEGRCSVCRAAKADRHHRGYGGSVPYAVALLLLTITVILAVQHLMH